MTDGSYFDGTGYAEIKFESQFGTTKRFEQEIRVVSYNGILFFLENQAGACCPGEPSSIPQLVGWGNPSPTCKCSQFRALGRRGVWRWQCCFEQYFCTIVENHKRAGPDLTAEAVACLVPEGLL